jgi:phage shock protein A
MLNEIRRIFRKSIDAFRQELGTREPEDEVAELLAAMRRELVAARAALPQYEADLAHIRVELAKERESVEVCERRATMAERIGDGETVTIARQFATRHAERVLIIQQKVAAAEAELVLRRREAEEMKIRYKEADANRFALLAQLRRSAAGERLRSSASSEEGAFADFARMEEKVEQGASILDALEELDEAPSRGPPVADRSAVEDRLQELKRRMGRAE